MYYTEVKQNSKNGDLQSLLLSFPKTSGWALEDRIGWMTALTHQSSSKYLG